MSLLNTYEEKIKKAEFQRDCFGSDFWFLDSLGDIYVIAHDSLINQSRAVYLGQNYAPFVLNANIADISVDRILAPGTEFKLQAESKYNQGGRV